MSSTTSDFKTIQKASECNILTCYSKIRNGLVIINGIEDSQSWELYNSIGDNVLSGIGSDISLVTLNKGIYLLEVRGELHRIVK